MAYTIRILKIANGPNNTWLVLFRILKIANGPNNAWLMLFRILKIANGPNDTILRLRSQTPRCASPEPFSGAAAPASGKLGHCAFLHSRIGSFASAKSACAWPWRLLIIENAEDKWSQTRKTLLKPFSAKHRNNETL